MNKTCRDTTCGVRKDQIIRTVGKHRLSIYPLKVSSVCLSLLDEDGVLLLVIVQAEAVASAKGHQLPLGVQGESSDHGRRLALYQGERLEARRKQNRLLSHIQPSVALIDEKNQQLTGWSFEILAAIVELL